MAEPSRSGRLDRLNAVVDPERIAAPVRETVFDQAIRSAWSRVLKLWLPMAGWTLLVWAAAAALLVPLSSSLLGRHLLGGPDIVFGNEDLLGWVLTPLGALYVLLAGGVALAGAVVRYAGLFHIVTDDLEGRQPTVRGTAFRLLPRLPALYRSCVAVVAAAIILLLPLVGGLAAVHALFLGAHDINYYMAVRPPEWGYALVAGALWAVLWGCGAAWVVGRTILALPARLDGHPSLRVAARRAWERTSGGAGRLLRLLGYAIGVWLLLRFVLNTFFLGASSALIGWIAGATTSLRPLVLATGTYVAGSFLLDAIVAFLGFSFVATVLTKYYYENTDLHEAAPPAPRLRELPGQAVGQVGQAVAGAWLWMRPGRAVGVAVVAVGGSFLASGFLLERVPEPRAAIISAHRAGPPPAPENTLAALERAIAAGADYSEIDVQRTRDGVVVVAHDADLMRVAGDPRRIATSDFAALQGVVQRPDDGTPAEERLLATLDDFMERARGRIGLNIELKYYGPDPLLAPEVVRLVRARGMEEEVVIMSLSLPAVRQVRELAPEITTGYLATVAVGDLHRLPVDFLAVPRQRVNARFLRAARESGHEVHAWTVNRAAEMAELIELGVDGIITDHPDVTRRVNAELADLSSASRLLLRFRTFIEPDPHAPAAEPVEASSRDPDTSPVGAPSSEAPSSEAPSSEAPSSEAPSSEAPSSEAPSSGAPPP